MVNPSQQNNLDESLEDQMTSIQEAIDIQTKNLFENESIYNLHASENFKRVKDDMHQMNEDIDDKIIEMKSDMNSKIEAVATKITDLSNDMDGKIETMAYSILNEIRNIKRRAG